MQNGTTDSAVQEIQGVTARDVTFPLVPLDNGRGFKILTDQISIAGEKLQLATGLPRKLTKMVKRQPHFGLRTAKEVAHGNILIEFDKPVDKMGDANLEKHVFTPMARKIRRSHQAVLPNKGSKGRRALSQPALAQATS